MINTDLAMWILVISIIIHMIILLLFSMGAGARNVDVTLKDYIKSIAIDILEDSKGYQYYILVALELFFLIPTMIIFASFQILNRVIEYMKKGVLNE